MNEYYVCIECGYVVYDDNCEWFGLFPMHEACYDKRIVFEEQMEEKRRWYTGVDERER